MKKETRGAPKKLPSEKVVPIMVYVKRKHHVKAKAAIKELASEFK